MRFDKATIDEHIATIKNRRGRKGAGRYIARLTKEMRPRLHAMDPSLIEYVAAQAHEYGYPQHGEKLLSDPAYKENSWLVTTLDQSFTQGALPRHHIEPLLVAIGRGLIEPDEIPCRIIEKLDDDAQIEAALLPTPATYMRREPLMWAVYRNIITIEDIKRLPGSTPPGQIRLNEQSISVALLPFGIVTYSYE